MHSDRSRYSQSARRTATAINSCLYRLIKTTKAKQVTQSKTTGPKITARPETRCFPNVRYLRPVRHGFGRRTMERFSSLPWKKVQLGRKRAIRTRGPPFVSMRGSEGHIPGRGFQELLWLCQRGPGGEGMMERFTLPPRRAGPIRITWSDGDRKEERRVLRSAHPGSTPETQWHSPSPGIEAGACARLGTQWNIEFPQLAVIGDVLPRPMPDRRRLRVDAGKMHTRTGCWTRCTPETNIVTAYHAHFIRWTVSVRLYYMWFVGKYTWNVKNILILFYRTSILSTYILEDDLNYYVLFTVKIDRKIYKWSLW